MRTKAFSALLCTILVHTLVRDAFSLETPVQKSSWDVYAEYPWWPEFADMLWTSPLYDPKHINKLLQTNGAQLKNEIYQLCENMTRFVGESLKLPLSNTVRPYNLTLNCAKAEYSDLLSGQPRTAPVKVVMAFHVMAEMHLLRLRLHTFDDLVDYFVVSEGTMGHQSHVRKPLIFETYKHMFAPFLNKIVHVVSDDRVTLDSVSSVAQLTANVVKQDNFHGEDAERLQVYNFLAHRWKELHPDDIILYSDADEFPDEDLVYHLKHCQLKNGSRLPFSSNAPFFQSDFRHPFRTDWPPAAQWPYSFKFPSIWTLKALQELKHWRLIRHHMVPGAPYPKKAGGYHLSSDAFLPHLFFKYLNNAEGGLILFNKEGARGLAHHNATAWYEAYRRGVTPWRSRIAPPKCLRDKYGSALDPPWLVTQNPQAFPWLFLNETAFYEAQPQPCPGFIRRKGARRMMRGEA